MLMLVKRRGQAQKAITEMIQKAMGYISETPDRMTKMELIKSLIEATEGKLYVEGEFAKATRMYAEMIEEDGDKEKAAKSILDVQVETYGSLTKEEKLDYLLYQMRIVLDLKDYVRTQIISKKVNRKNLNEKGLELLKVQYLQHAI